MIANVKIGRLKSGSELMLVAKKDLLIYIVWSRLEAGMTIGGGGMEVIFIKTIINHVY
jgi:hypothetical protein